MGETKKQFLIKKSFDSSRESLVDFLLDSGATYSVVPKAVLTRLGIQPHRTVEVEFADGRRSLRQVGDAYFEYNGEGAASPVIFGEKDEEALLGVFALESLGLVLNPFKREIYPGRVIRL